MILYMRYYYDIYAAARCRFFLLCPLRYAASCRHLCLRWRCHHFIYYVIHARVDERAQARSADARSASRARDMPPSLLIVFAAAYAADAF